MPAVLAPPAVFHVPPPYERLEAVPDVAALGAEQLPDASLVAVGVVSPEEGGGGGVGGGVWGEVADLVPRLRARMPAVPVVLRVGRPAESAGGSAAPGWGDAELERRAAALRMRAVVYEGEPLRPRLRAQLTHPANLADDLVEWLPLRLPGLPPAILELVGTIVERSSQFAEVGALLESVDRAERTVRTWFRRAGVPGPGKWLAAAHALRAALRLQAEDHAPLLALAVECGYSDHSSLSRQSLRLFGVRPGVIRRTLGWEWLLDRWLGRSVRRL